MDGQRVVDVGAVVDQARLRPVSAVALALCVMVATCDGFDNSDSKGPAGNNRYD